VTVALRDLRVRDNAWARVDPAHRDAHRRLWTDVVRRAQPGHVAAPASMLAFAARQFRERRASDEPAGLPRGGHLTLSVKSSRRQQ